MLIASLEIDVGELGDEQGALLGVQDAAPTRPGVGADLLGVQRHPAKGAAAARSAVGAAVAGGGSPAGRGEREPTSGRGSGGP